MAKVLSALGSKATTFFRLLSRTDSKTEDANAIQYGTQRATHESYELNNDNDHIVPGLPDFKDKNLSEESVTHLV